MPQVIENLLTSLPAGLAEAVGAWVAVLLTLAVFTYIFGSNPLFRGVEYLFIGVAAGYATTLAWTQVLWPRIELLVLDPVTYWYYGLFFALGLMLLTRESRFLSVLGNLPLGVLFGTGAALAVGGALTGSVIPQLRATMLALDVPHRDMTPAFWVYVVDGLFLVFGTMAVLSATHFTARGRGFLSRVAHGLVRVFGVVGRGLLMVTLGALFAGAMLSFFAILNGRLLFLVDSWIKLFGNAGL